MKPLNLASRPFRNQTLPALAFWCGSALLLAASLAQGLALKRLLSQRASAFHQEVATLEAESSRLNERARQLQALHVDKASLARWTLVKELVDRRLFSWTELLASLESVAPPGVRLLSITPQLRSGVITLDLTAEVGSAEDGIAFVRALEESPQFAEVYPLAVSERDRGAEFRYSLRYRPPAAGTALPAPTAQAPEADPEAEEARP